MLRDVISTMKELKNVEINDSVLERLEQAGDDLDYVYDEEQCVYDNLPENFMFSQRANILLENIYNLIDALCDMAAVIDAYKQGDTNPYCSVENEILSVIRNCTEAIERV